jgi:hypothetical protein
MKTILTAEQVYIDLLEFAEKNPKMGWGRIQYLCELHTDYWLKDERGRWNPEMPDDQQIRQAAARYAEEFFGIDGHINQW